jgi:hypothetical protein
MKYLETNSLLKEYTNKLTLESKYNALIYSAETRGIPFLLEKRICI